MSAIDVTIINPRKMLKKIINECISCGQTEEPLKRVYIDEKKTAWYEECPKCGVIY
jgi:predicted RNA-binding Zn-ribbon protein involved in translation (DUF1610 family)